MQVRESKFCFCALAIALSVLAAVALFWAVILLFVLLDQGYSLVVGAAETIQHPMLHFLKSTFERLVTADSFSKIYHDTVILFCVLLFGFLFRKSLANLFERITSNENPLTGKTDFGKVLDKIQSQAPASHPAPAEAAQAAAPPPAAANLNLTAAVQEHPIERYKSAHFYWLGSDLADAIRIVALAPNKEQTVQCLSQALRHYRKAGLPDSLIEDRLKWLIKVNTETVQSVWMTDTNRRDMLNEIVVIKGRIDQATNLFAGDKFKPWVD